MRRLILPPTTAGTGQVLIAGVGAGDGGLEVEGLDPGVDGGGVETGVAEELLDVPDVGAALQQVRRAGMPQIVRRERVRDVGTLGVQVHQALDGLHAQPRAVAGEKERRFVRVAHQARTGVAEVAIDRLGGPPDERDEAVLAALAFADDEDALPELDVSDIQPLAFADAEADAVEEFEDGARALAARRAGDRDGRAGGGPAPGRGPPRAAAATRGG